MIYIYGLRCPLANTIRYVGKSVSPEKRVKAHIMSALRGDYNHRTARWIRKIAAAGHTPELVILHQVAEGERWQDVERSFIGSSSERGWKLTNSTAGGEGLDYIDPVAKDAYRSKLSESLKVVWGTPEARQSASERSLKAWANPDVTARRLASMKAAHKRPEVREKTLKSLAEIRSDPVVKAKKAASISASWRTEAGEKRRSVLRSDATRQKMSESAKRKWANPVKAAANNAANADPEKRRRLSELAKLRATPEYRAMMAEKTRLSWEKRRAKAGAS